MLDITPVASRTLTLDTVRYALSVYEDSCGFVAFWECDHCLNSGHRTAVFPECDAAIRECEKAISKHHTKSHPIALEV